MSRDMNLECKVYVGDLPRDLTEKEIEREFETYGRLKKVWLARNPPGFAFVEFEDARDAEDAIAGLDGQNRFGNRIRVEASTGKRRVKPWERDDGRGGPPSRGPPRGRGPPRYDPYGRGDERGDRSYDRGGRYGGRDNGGRDNGGYSGRQRSRSPPPRRRRSYSRSNSGSPVRGRGGRSPRSPPTSRGRYSRSGSRD